MQATIIIPESMNKAELIWFCAQQQHVPVCENLKKTIQARRHARKNRQKKWHRVNKKYKRQDTLRREQEMREFLEKTDY